MLDSFTIRWGVFVTNLTFLDPFLELISLLIDTFRVLKKLKVKIIIIIFLGGFCHS